MKLPNNSLKYFETILKSITKTTIDISSLIIYLQRFTHYLNISQLLKSANAEYAEGDHFVRQV